MSGFNFGTGGLGSSFSFGTNQQTTAPTGGLFGATNTAPSFGSGTTSLFASAASQPSVGMATGQTSGLTFGAPASTTGTALTFGAPASTAGTGLTFGAPASTAGTGLTFGAPASTAGTGLTFGAPASTVGAGLTFGAPASTATTGLTFGAPASTGGAGLNFGAPTSTTATGLTFGATPATSFPFSTPATTTGLSFGAPASTTSAGLNFAMPVSSAPSTGLMFGTPATGVSSGLGFGSQQGTATNTGMMFGGGVPATTTSAPGTLSLGGAGTGSLFGAPAATTTSGFSLGSFGSLQTATSTAPSGLTFGSATPATSGATLSFQGLGAAKPLGGSLFSTPATSTTASRGFGLAATTTSSGFGLFAQPSKPTASIAAIGAAPTTTTTSVGLGGVEAKSGLTGLGTHRPESKAVKENEIPVELIQTIDGFKNFVKTQKSWSSEIARGSAQPLHKVEEDIDTMKKVLSNLGADLKRHTALADNLKYDTAKCLQNAEMAQRTHDMPPELQYNNTAPQQYFEELVAKFESEVGTFAVAIEDAEKHLHSLAQPRALSPDELTSAMQRIHDTFVFLAGRLQMAHNSVEIQKQQYLNLRKYFLKDPTNVFEKQLDKPSGEQQKPRSTANTLPGPSPFSGIGTQMGIGLIFSSASDTPSALPTNNPLGWGSLMTTQQPPQQLLQTPAVQSTVGFGLGSAASPFSSQKTPQPVENQSFQLQRPPVGNKRGKR